MINRSSCLPCGWRCEFVQNVQRVPTEKTAVTFVTAATRASAITRRESAPTQLIPQTKRLWNVSWFFEMSSMHGDVFTLSISNLTNRKPRTGLTWPHVLGARFKIPGTTSVTSTWLIRFDNFKSVGVCFKRQILCLTRQ